MLLNISMLQKFCILVVASLCVRCSSFVFGSFPITGDVGPNYSMYAVPRSAAYEYIKKVEIKSISRNEEKFVVDELSEAREVCRSRSHGDTFVTFINEKGCEEPDYVILYRKTRDTPTVYTIDHMLVNSEKKVQMSIGVLEKVVRDFCGDHRGHLQTYPLKTRSSGRYFNAMRLEKSLS